MQNVSPQQPCILIIDDTPSNIQILAQGLSKHYHIQIATSGRAALSLLEQHTQKPDLILLDIMMPEMDGYTVCQQLKGNPLTRPIPVIFVSARSEVLDQQRGFDLGAVDYITKPIELPLVLARVAVHIRLKRQTEQLERLALLDGLTELPNRRALDEQLANECRRSSRSATPLSVLMIDIDFFKLYNDHYGHGAGDVCLKTVSQAIESRLQRPSDFIGRYGGEEFVVILANCDEVGAQIVGNNLCQYVQQLAIPHAHSTVAPVVTISIGIASRYIHSEETPEKILQQADQALYEAKRMGRNCAVSSQN